MKLIIVSGRSGSGKSTALHVLEDLGFYCIDNLPIGLLFPLTREAATQEAPGRLKKMAVSIDARNLSAELANFETIYQQLKQTGVEVEIIFLDADEQSLLQRFHATRRKHPLSDDKTSLREAITNEKQLLEPLSKLADLYVNTTGLSMYELRDMIKQRVAGRKDQELALLFQSFGFKHGVPVDSDYVFDVRCLPNPYWDTSLRKHTGVDQPGFLGLLPEFRDAFVLGDHHAIGQLEGVFLDSDGEEPATLGVKFQQPLKIYPGQQVAVNHDAGQVQRFRQ